MLAAVLGWVLPCQSTPSLLHKRPKGRFGLHAIVLVLTYGILNQCTAFPYINLDRMKQSMNVW